MSMTYNDHIQRVGVADPLELLVSSDLGEL